MVGKRTWDALSSLNVVALMAAMTAVGCKDDETRPHEEEHCGCGDIGPGGPYVPFDAGPQIMTYRGNVVEGVPGKLLQESPLADVEVCPVDPQGERLPESDCDTTDAEGAYEVKVPVGNAAVRYAKSGYLSQLAPVDAHLGTTVSLAAVRLAPLIDDAGTPMNFGWNPETAIDPNKGLAVVFAVELLNATVTGTAGLGADYAKDVSFTISPALPNGAGDGPDYMDRDEVYVPSAKGTAGAYAWFVNVPPGTYTITAHSPSMTCTGFGNNGFGWPEQGGGVKIPVLAGTTTQSAGFTCTRSGSK